MPDKAMSALSEPDRLLRLADPVGMQEGVKQLIVRHCGFELYNTRPYHNYENWSDGYMVFGRRDGKTLTNAELTAFFQGQARGEDYLTVSREDLDEAIRVFATQLAPDLETKEARFRKVGK